MPTLMPSVRNEPAERATVYVGPEPAIVIVTPLIAVTAAKSRRRPD
jgi:hypothetical protein